MKRKFTVVINIKMVAATSLISMVTLISPSAIAQEGSDATSTAPVEAVAAEVENEKAASSDPLTTEDPKIPLNQLDILVKPLSQKQLIVEADAWKALLVEQSRDISQKEVTIKRQELAGDIDENLLVKVTQLQGEQAQLIQRVNTVVEALEVKGGDIAAYRQYLDAVSGLEFSLTNTEGLSVRFITWLQAEDGGIRLLINLVKFAGVLVVTAFLAPRLTKLAQKGLSKVDGISELFRDFAVTYIKRSIYVVGGLIAIAALGFDLGPVLAVIGGASFVLAFALQSNLGNFASGLLLLISKPFDVGDEVKVAGYWAYVDSIALANTKLKDFSGNLVTLPNNIVWGGDIINYTHAETRKVKLGINIKIDQDIEQIRALWVDIASSHPKILSEPAPSYFPWNATYDYHIWVGLSAWTKTTDYWGVYIDLLKALQKRLSEENIELAAPIQTIRLDGDTSSSTVAAQLSSTDEVPQIQESTVVS